MSLEEHGRVDVQRPWALPERRGFHAQMQHHEALVGQAHEHRDNPAGRPASVTGEQRLYAFDVAHPNAQASVLLVNLRDSVGRYGLLNPDADPVLIRV